MTLPENNTPDENTHDPADARRALHESRANKRQTDKVIADAQQTFSLIRAHREANHYVDKFRAILRGTHP